MHRRQLPIGIQDFRTIREQDMSNVHPQPPGARTPADHDDDATRRCCWPGTNEPLPVTFTTQWSARTPQEWEDDNPQADAPPWEPRPYTMIAMPATTRALYVTGYIVLAMRHPSIGLGFDWRTDLQGPPGRVAHRCDDPVFATGAAMTARAFGDAEIVDLRPALASAHHPDAQRDTPVWGATHVRAALELAWEQLDAIVHGGAKTTLCDNYDWRTMRVWLHRSERVRAVALGHAMARASHDMPLEQWRMWLDMLAQ